jgi:hypothetical protein
MGMESRQDVIHWMRILHEHHLAHAANDEKPPLFIHVDPAEMVQAMRALSREGFGLPSTTGENHEL